MKLSVVIVSWNVKDYLLKCLESLYQNQVSAGFEVILVDNASADGTTDSVKPSFPHIKLVANTKNLGFAAANNQAIARSQGEYILLLNPDTIIHPGSLDVLIDFMDHHSDIGACGPKLLNPDGTTQRSVRAFPSFRAALYRHTAFRSFGIFKNRYQQWRMKDFTYNQQADVDQLMGAALMLRKAVIDQVGKMDESFFMYYEEVDLCFRIKQAGWRIVFYPDAVITHLGGQSARQIPVDKQMMAMTSLLKFFAKHRGKSVTRLFACFFNPAILVGQMINIAVNALRYTFAALMFNRQKRQKWSRKVRNSTLLLLRYPWLR